MPPQTLDTKIKIAAQSGGQALCLLYTCRWLYEADDKAYQANFATMANNYEVCIHYKYLTSPESNLHVATSAH